MSLRTLSCWLACAVLASGCAHSEDEWRAKVREVDDLKVQLGREQSAGKARDEAGARLEKLEKDLREAGIDPEIMKSNAELQARALEEYRRRTEQLAAAKKRFAALKDRLAPLAKDGVTVAARHNRVVISLPGDVVFDNGRETIRREGKDLIAKVAEVIRSDPGLEKRPWQVAGHLDSGKPGGAFRDGYGLSAMRAREVLALLKEPVGRGGGGLRATQWTAIGYGDGDPVADNGTPEGKARNRRCEIVLPPTPEETLDLGEIGK